MPTRRHFIAQLGAGAAAGLLDADELRAGTSAAGRSEWDTSWLDRLAPARFRVVFNVNEIGEGAALYHVATFLEHFAAVHGTAEAETRPVAVFRRQGTPMAFADAMWDRYALGADHRITDPATREPARRNVYWRAAPGASAESAAARIEPLHARGLISLVCNVSLGNWGRSIGARVGRDPAEVTRDLAANLVPGAIVVPSGIYALIRAQNAGCAVMPGT